MKGMISGIKRMEIHDGDGLRTTVFFKGCPLNCVWCHNPESIGYKGQLAFFEDKCIHCGACYEACKHSAVNMDGFRIDFDKCTHCLECADVCPTEAIVPYGREYTEKELVNEIMTDAPFFKNGRGGVTLSGGECLSRPEFAVSVARLLKENGISVYIDTCGYVKREALTDIIPYTDKFLFDIKAAREDTHIRATGKSNKLIIDNLKYLNSMGCDIEIRIPYVPEYNADEMSDIAELISTLTHISAVKVLPYHNFAASRYKALGMEDTLPEALPTAEDCDKMRNIIKARCPDVKVE